MKRADLVRHLQTHGCEFFREGSRHSVFVNRATRKSTAVPRHREVNEWLAKKICRDLEIPESPLLDEGTAVVIQNIGEGWFPLAPASEISSVVIRAIPHPTGGEPYYLLRLASPLEVQEPGHSTPSGLALRSYSHVVARSRWLGVPLGSAAHASAHIWLVPEGAPLPASGSKYESLAPRIWAACRVGS